MRSIVACNPGSRMRRATKGKSDARWDLAEFDSDVELKAEEQLLFALVSGCCIQSAASSVGIAVWPAYRRLAPLSFAHSVQNARQSRNESILPTLSDAGYNVEGVLRGLMQSTVRRRAVAGRQSGVGLLARVPC